MDSRLPISRLVNPIASIGLGIKLESPGEPGTFLNYRLSNLSVVLSILKLFSVTDDPV